METSLARFNRFYRFSEWAHFLGFVFLGILFGVRSGNLDLLLMLQVLIASSLFLAFAYSFNVLFDSELEALATPSHDVVVTRRPRRLLLSLSTAVAGLALLVPFLSSFLLGLVFVFIWALYSYPVSKLKAVPILCTIINGVGFSILFLIGFASVRPLSGSSALFFGLLVLLEIPAQLIHEVAHSEVDAAFAVTTTAVRYGMRRCFDGCILSLLGSIIWVVLMASQGVVDVLAALSIGFFAGAFALVFLREREIRREVTAFPEKQSVEHFSSLRTRYKYGGILAGAVLLLTLL
jgi:4-hydroxybenzoate polyprenyltransferase